MSKDLPITRCDSKCTRWTHINIICLVCPYKIDGKVREQGCTKASRNHFQNRIYVASLSRKTLHFKITHVKITNLHN